MSECEHDGMFFCGKCGKRMMWRCNRTRSDMSGRSVCREYNPVRYDFCHFCGEKRES